MIRINLLPRAQRRRRRLRLRRDAVLGGVMLLGWAVATGFGYMWIAGHSQRAAELRVQASAALAATRQLEKKGDNSALAERQRVLRIREQALHQLREARSEPAPELTELATLFAVDGDAPVHLLELRASTPGAWRVDGLAPDVLALGDLVRQLEACAKFNLSYGPEYARADDGSLRFRLDLKVVTPR